MKNYDLVIIGGGPAGMAAALSAYEDGTKDILIIERDVELGGILTQCLHVGFGFEQFGEELSGPEYTRRVTEKLFKTGIEYITDTMVLKIDDKTIHAINSESGYIKINAKAIILAMGCYERTCGAIGVHGSRPAGIYAAGAAQKLINKNGLLPGKKTVILGSGDIGLITARAMTLAGAKVEAVFEILPRSTGLPKNIESCLNEFDIPLILGTTITKIHGSERVEGVTVAKVDDNRKPIASTEKFIPCDSVMLSVGLIPENDISRNAEIDIDHRTLGPFVGELRQTCKEGIFACGNVLHVHDLVDHVSEEGTLAGLGASKYIKEQFNNGFTHTIVPTDDIGHIVPQRINIENIDDTFKLFMRLKEVAKNSAINVYLGDKIIAQKKEDIFLPAEMARVEINKEYLAKSPEEELVIKVEPV